MAVPEYGAAICISAASRFVPMQGTFALAIQANRCRRFGAIPTSVCKIGLQFAAFGKTLRALDGDLPLIRSQRRKGTLR